MRNIQDRWTPAISGFLILALLIGLAVWQVPALLKIAETGLVDGLIPAPFVLIGLALFFFIVVAPGFVVLQPNESLVVVFFGHYLGTIRHSGFHWIIPFTTRRRVSLRVVNLNTKTLKVNDARGNPIEIGAVVVWHVGDSAKAVLNVEDYRDFVSVQSETAVRALASRYPYDTDDELTSLRGSPEALSADLQTELQQRLLVAGIEIIETRLSHLAYAPEIASAMLRRQQAEAVVRARRIITENAVDIVDRALAHLEETGAVDANSPERMRLISNLLVALVSERDAQPVVDLSA